MKIDLHCHSKYSKRPTLWLMQKLGCPESFTEPLELYDLALRKGMSSVTITDHNVIDGALEIAHLPGAVMGCEYTTYFPEDHCKVQVLVYAFTEAQHRELTRTRENIYDFVEYLRAQQLPNVCAHPLFGVNDRLTPAHIEKLALLFKNWEWNGDQCLDMNAAMRKTIETLTPARIEALADKHGIAPQFPEPWKKNITSGSDDHSSLNLCRAFTEVRGADTFEEFWAGVEQGQALVHCRDASPEMFARNVYGIAYQFYKSRLGLERHVNKNTLLRFLDRTLQSRPDATPDPWISRLYLRFSGYRRSRTEAHASLFQLLRDEAEKLLAKDPQLLHLVSEHGSAEGDIDQKWFEFLQELSNRMLANLEKNVAERFVGGRLFDLFHSLGSAGALYALVAPYFISYSHFAQQRRFGREVLEAFGGVPEAARSGKEARIAHFTDTFDDVNGVALTLQHQLRTSQSLGYDYAIVTCSEDRKLARAGVRNFPAVTAYALPEYNEIKLLVPPFLQMLRHCFEQRYTHLHIATPGPVGLAGLAIARILGLPVSGTYHTALPQYARTLTEDTYVEDTMWRYMVWFHEQLDQVYVPSAATGDELKEHGLSAGKVRVYPRGVDTEQFHPGLRDEDYLRSHAVGEGPVLLYVGRVSREKNLPLLVEAYRALLQHDASLQLLVVGDGPYRAEMEAELQGTPAAFTGYLASAEVARLMATANLFVFPSTTDTFGNVVLEAQACGLPVVVSNVGGPCENLVNGETGLILRENSAVAWTAALQVLLQDAERLRRMGAAARRYAEERSFDAAFVELWEMFTGDPPGPAQAKGIEPLSFSLAQALAI